MKYVRSLALLGLTGCGLTLVRVEPVKVQPIHITVDVNVHDVAKPSRKAP